MTECTTCIEKRIECSKVADGLIAATEKMHENQMLSENRLSKIESCLETTTQLQRKNTESLSQLSLLLAKMEQKTESYDELRKRMRELEINFSSLNAKTMERWKVISMIIGLGVAATLPWIVNHLEF